jgi:hypothetical protein
MANFSDYLENQLGDLLFRTGNFTKPAGIWLAMCSGIPHDTHTGSTLPELTGGNYARWAMGPPSDNAWVRFNPGGSGIILNASGLKPISGWTGGVVQISGAALCDAATGGNVLVHGALSTAKQISSPDDVTFASGTISFQIL